MSCTPPRDAQSFLFSFLGTETQADAVSCAPPAPPPRPPWRENILGAALGCGTQTRPVSRGQQCTDGLWHPRGSLGALGSRRAGMSLRVRFVGRGRTGTGVAIPGEAWPYRERRESSRAERSGGGSSGSTTGTGSGIGDGDVPQGGREGESSGIGAVHGAPRAAGEPRSRSRAARWVRAGVAQTGGP